MNWVLALRALAAPKPAALPRHRSRTAETIAVNHAACSKSEAANSHTAEALLQNPRISRYLTPLSLCHADALGSAESVEAVQKCDADVDFRGLSLPVSCGDAFAEGFEAAHPCLDAASGMISRPAFPERTAVVTGGTQCLVAGLRSWAILFTRAAVFAYQDDRGGHAQPCCLRLEMLAPASGKKGGACAAPFVV